MPNRITTIAVACLIANMAMTGCGESAEQSPLRHSAGPSPLPSSVAALLVAQAPAIEKSSFGASVDVHILHRSILFSEARVVDETLYVMYYPLDSANQQIAMLSEGVLHPVLLSHDYMALRFENDNRVISAMGEENARDWYELRGGRAVAIPGPASPVYGIPHHVLADGDTCADGLAGSGSALDDIRAHRRVSILSIAAMSRATHGALPRAVGVYCDHFHGKNYATMDIPGVIFRIDGHQAALVSTGWIEAASERHLLIESGAKFIEAEVR